MPQHYNKRNIPPVDIELVDVDNRPLSIDEVKKKAYVEFQ